MKIVFIIFYFLILLIRWYNKKAKIANINLNYDKTKYLK